MVSLAEFGGWSATINTLIDGTDITADHAAAALTSILEGDATSAQIAGYVVALRSKGETADELAGMLGAARAAMTTVPLTEAERDACIDVVGTGGDGSNSINVSTMASLVVAGAGERVCKHGNRSASSQAGTADVFETLGVAIDLHPEGVARCVREAGIGFCLATSFHPAFRFAGPPRREMGISTAFNLLGPMANPGRVRRQLIGVADPRFARPMADALAAQGVVSAWVVHGGGLDELTTTGPSEVISLDRGQITSFTVDPASLGVAPATRDDLVGGSADDNAAVVHAVLGGAGGPHRDIVLLNAAAALVVAGRTSELAEGLDVAAESIDSGKAAEALAQMVAVSQDAVNER